MQIKLLFGCIDDALGQTLDSEFVNHHNLRIACRTTPLASVPASVGGNRPDVILLENDERGEALQILSHLLLLNPGTRALLLYESYTQGLVIESIRHGASGYLLKYGERTLWAKAIRAVHDGQTWFGRDALLQALQSQIRVTPAATLIEEGRLTLREAEILGLIGSGLTNKEIARHLKISDKTVKTHLHRVYVKLKKSGRYKAYLSRPRFAVPM